MIEDAVGESVNLIYDDGKDEQRRETIFRERQNGFQKLSKRIRCQKQSVGEGRETTGFE